MIPNPTATRRLPKILCVAHGSIESNSGGVEVYQRIIADQLRSQFEFLFFAPDLNLRGGRTYRLYSLDSGTIENHTLLQPVLQEHLRHEELERLFREVLIRNEIALVHFHHLLRQVPSLPAIARESGIPVVFSAHDYYAVCDEYNLLNAAGQYCGVLEAGTQNCDSCLYLIRGCKKGSQTRRIRGFEEALSVCDRVLFNTEGARDSFLRLFLKLKKSRTAVFGAPSGTKFSQPVRRSTQGPLVILVPNGLSKIKGGEFIGTLLEILESYPVEFHFFGRLDRGFSKRDLKNRNRNVVFHGAYTREDLIAFAPRAHLSLHASIWPETYCISLSEMWDLGVVPIATRMGALAERIQSGNNGYLVEPRDAEAIRNVILDILKDRKALEDMRMNLNATLSVSAESCAEKMAAEYERLLGEVPTFAKAPSLVGSGYTTWVTGLGPKSRFLRRLLQAFRAQA